MKTYRIETKRPHEKNWKTLTMFRGMNRSFADGAWAMLESYYDTVREFRLIQENSSSVLGHISVRKIKANSQSMREGVKGE